jgi:hypothetical protein
MARAFSTTPTWHRQQMTYPSEEATYIGRRQILDAIPASWCCAGSPQSRISR